MKGQTFLLKEGQFFEFQKPNKGAIGSSSVVSRWDTFLSYWRKIALART